MIRYAHTNIIAKDCQKLINFYKKVFGCKSIGEKRDLKGKWLDALTGLENSHIIGEHLSLPGYEENFPTLEIFSYPQIHESSSHKVNSHGFAHIAFQVDDVDTVLQQILLEGGGMVGEVAHTQYEDGHRATFVYATDIEGNIIELQSWK